MTYEQKTLDLSKKVSQKHQQVDGKKKELRVIENEKMQKQKQVLFCFYSSETAISRLDQQFWVWAWFDHVCRTVGVHHQAWANTCRVDGVL